MLLILFIFVIQLHGIVATQCIIICLIIGQISLRNLHDKNILNAIAIYHKKEVLQQVFKGQLNIG